MPKKKRPSSTHAAWENLIKTAGAAVCAQWRESFRAFIEDMGFKPSSLHHIGLINPRGIYGPGNCLWIKGRPSTSVTPKVVNRATFVKISARISRPSGSGVTQPALESSGSSEELNSIEILHRHRDSLVGFAIRLCRCPDVAQDLAQEALLKAFKSREQFEPGTNLKAWLYTILKNCWRSYLRRCRWLDQNAAYLAQPHSVDCAAGSEIDAALLIEAIQKLPPHHLQAVLAFANGLDCEEAAKQIGIPEGTFKSRLHRARETLRS